MGQFLRQTAIFWAFLRLTVNATETLIHSYQLPSIFL